jgi:signal transduction histidine kinase
LWLGLQLLDQDQALWSQRELEGRQALSESIIRSLEQSLTEAQGKTEAPLPDGMVRFTLSRDGLTAEPAGRLLWFPVSARFEEAETRRFEEAEKLEYQGREERALLTYKRIAESAKPAARAGALLRLARVYRRAERWEDTSSAYRQLAQMNQIAIDNMPADLLARRAICSILAKSGNTQELDRQAAALEEDLLAGKWVLDRPAWELTAQQLERWNGRPLSLSEERIGFSTAASWLWDVWQRNPEEDFSISGSLSVGEMTLVPQFLGSQVSVIVVSPAVLDTWVEEALGADVDAGHKISLLTSSGHLLVGPQPTASAAAAKKSTSETGLPWTLVLSPGDSSPLAQEMADRRRLLSLGLAAILLLLAGASYLLWRVIRKELAVARLQTEFVAAVSHEFRTPLASLRHVTELMQEDDDLPPDRRRSFYEALGRNTERLHRLVESLLDFARMEGRKKPYDLQPLDAGELVEEIVADFRREVEPRGFIVDFENEDPGSLALLADAQSLSNALWNLLDNAVKYSPEGGNIRLSVRRHPDGLEIAVCDDGLGIPRVEQKEIFRRFVRGERVSRLGIKGTGLGLAMVSHIVRAHGGKMELESEEGVGSTFRVVLPSHG